MPLLWTWRIRWSTPFEKLGYEVVKVYSSSQGITKVDVKRGNSETTFYAMSYTVTDEVQDVVVDTVGDTTVGPVAEDAEGYQHRSG